MRRAAGIGGKRQPVALITGAVADGVNRVNNGYYVSDYGDSDNHIEEVIHSNNEHHEYPVISGRLEQLADRQ